jgi:hypothetical protein
MGEPQSTPHRAAFLYFTATVNITFIPGTSANC